MIIIKCLLCNKMIQKKLLWKNLFSDEILLRCNKCDDKYRINLQTKVYELKGGFIDLFRLFDKKYRLNPNAYIFELGELINWVIERYDLYNSEAIIIYVDDSFFILNNQKLLTYLFKMTDKIIIISLI